MIDSFAGRIYWQQQEGETQKAPGFSTLCNWKNGVLVGRTGLEKVGV